MYYTCMVVRSNRHRDNKQINKFNSTEPFLAKLEVQRQFRNNN